MPGGRGQIGSILTRHFIRQGHEVVLLTRSPTGVTDQQPDNLRIVSWDPGSSGHWVSELDGSDVVINLAGRSVNCRYTRDNREQIMNSRLASTRAIGSAISNCTTPPKVWLQSSTATIYAHSIEQANDESGSIGGTEHGIPNSWKFSVEVAEAWERAANEFKSSHTRLIMMRTSMVMSPDKGGIFDVLMGLVRKGLGGKNASGTQFVSWIHEYDFVNSVQWLIDHSDLEGIVNICSPNPIPNDDFMSTLREAAGISLGLPASRWMLELGAIFMRTETELVLKSRRVIPGVLLKCGFEFQFPQWEQAVDELVTRWISAKQEC